MNLKELENVKYWLTICLGAMDSDEVRFDYGSLYEAIDFINEVLNLDTTKVS